MSRSIENAFPRLRGTLWSVTSPADARYNCIAWTVHDPLQWWWPDHDYYWPSDPPFQWSLEAFLIAYRKLGFEVCDSPHQEEETTKIAIFADHDGRPTHGARQLPNGRWTSKLGKEQDIEHELQALEGSLYGDVAVILKRSGEYHNPYSQTR